MTFPTEPGGRDAVHVFVDEKFHLTPPGVYLFRPDDVGGVLNTCLDVFYGDRRIVVGNNLLEGNSFLDKFQHVLHRYPSTCYAGLAKMHFRIDLDAIGVSHR